METVESDKRHSFHWIYIFPSQAVPRDTETLTILLRSQLYSWVMFSTLMGPFERQRFFNTDR